MSDQTPYLRTSRCLVLEARRQSVGIDAASYDRFVIRKAAAVAAREGEHLGNFPGGTRRWAQERVSRNRTVMTSKKEVPKTDKSFSGGRATRCR